MSLLAVERIGLPLQVSIADIIARLFKKKPWLSKIDPEAITSLPYPSGLSILSVTIPFSLSVILRMASKRMVSNWSEGIDRLLAPTPVEVSGRSEV